MATASNINSPQQWQSLTGRHQSTHPNLQNIPKYILNKLDVYDAHNLEPIYIQVNYPLVSSVFDTNTETIMKNIDRFGFEMIKLTDMPLDSVYTRYRRTFYVVPHKKAPPEPLEMGIRFTESAFYIKIDRKQRALLKQIRNCRRTSYNELKKQIVITSKIKARTHYTGQDEMDDFERLKYLRLIKPKNKQTKVGLWGVTALGREYLLDSRINLKYD